MLEARGITYAYPGAARALYQGFDLAVAPDERVALCAPSGFGKTTLCRLLAGYERPQAGEVLDPRMRMGATLAEAGEVPGRLLDDLGIQKRWLSRYPHELSGGELQRFCIARALAANPRYLVADEVSTMLDALTQVQIWRFLMDETSRRGIGLVFVSHSPALTDRIATRVVRLGA